MAWYMYLNKTVTGLNQYYGLTTCLLTLILSDLLFSYFWYLTCKFIKSIVRNNKTADCSVGNWLILYNLQSNFISVTFNYTCQIHGINRRHVWFVICHVYYETLCNDLRTCILFINIYTLFWLIRFNITINLSCEYQNVYKQHSSHSGGRTSQPLHSKLWQESDIGNNPVKKIFLSFKIQLWNTWK